MISLLFFDVCTKLNITRLLPSKLDGKKKKSIKNSDENAKNSANFK